MPHKFKRPCFYPGCPELTAGQYCPTHLRLVNRQYEQYQRDPATRARYGPAWRRIRSRHLKDHPLCETCREKGRLTPATTVHHILPLADGGTHDFTNLKSLCTSHHSSLHLAERNKKPK